MKFVVLLGDGMADHPVPELGYRTPLQAARTPYMDRLAASGRSGLAATVPSGMTPGSDVANLSVMGYDPHLYYSGRAPLEAAAMDVRLEEDDVAFRCNFVTVNDGIMEDYSAGHITSEEGKEIIASLKHLAPGERLYAGVSYRNILVMKAGAEAECTPPHDIMDQPIKLHMPKGKDAELIISIMQSAAPILADHQVNRRRMEAGQRPANMIWLWGQGKAPTIPSFKERYHLQGAVISAVDLLKGIGVYAGLEVIDVPGATGTIDTNYEGKVEAALNALRHLDLVYLHIEAPDEASHEGELKTKLRAIELFDGEVVRPVLEGLKASGQPWRILLMPDHPTPLEIRTHTAEPVPFVMAGEGIRPDGAVSFDEQAAKGGGFGLIEGPELMGLLIKS